MQTVNEFIIIFISHKQKQKQKRDVLKVCAA